MTSTICFTQTLPNHHFRTEIPNIIFELGLDTSTFLIYCYIKKIAGDNGACWQSMATLEKATNLSQPTIKKCLDKLVNSQNNLNLKLLNKTERFKPDGSRDTTLYEVIDVWQFNGNFYRDTPQKIGGGVPKIFWGGTQNSLYKEEPYKNKLASLASVEVVHNFSRDEANAESHCQTEKLIAEEPSLYDPSMSCQEKKELASPPTCSAPPPNEGYKSPAVLLYEEKMSLIEHLEMSIENKAKICAYSVEEIEKALAVMHLRNASPVESEVGYLLDVLKNKRWVNRKQQDLLCAISWMRLFRILKGCCAHATLPSYVDMAKSMIRLQTSRGCVESYFSSFSSEFMDDYKSIAALHSRIQLAHEFNKTFFLRPIVQGQPYEFKLVDKNSQPL